MFYNVQNVECIDLRFAYSLNSLAMCKTKNALIHAIYLFFFKSILKIMFIKSDQIMLFEEY